jgi:hypothetical protein
MWLGSNTEKKAAIPDAFFKIIICGGPQNKSTCPSFNAYTELHSKT